MASDPHADQHVGHLSPRTRAQIIHMVECDHVSQRGVAAVFGVSQPAVSKLIRRYRETGDLVEHHGGGRIRSYDDLHMHYIDYLILSNPSATAWALKLLMPPGTPDVTERTIRNYRHQLGFTARSPGISVIDTEKQLRERRLFALKHRFDDMFSWVYMDESTMCLRDTGDVVWVKRGQPTPPHQIAGLRCSVHLWGAVWNEDSVFSFYTGSLTAAAYLALITPHLTPHLAVFQRKVIVHDRASWHSDRLVRPWFIANGLQLLRLPPHSPQFNAIEGCWSWIKRQVRQMGPTDHISLEHDMKHAYELLRLDTIQAQIQHSQDQLRAEAKLPVPAIVVAQP